MAAVMKATEFVNKLKDIANNYKTLYIMGCFGAPMTAANKKRYCNNNDYNTKAERTEMINAASTDTFGFDCVCLIKSVLWGWCGDKTKTYGGAKYKSNGVPDIGADSMIKVCSDVSTDFSNIKIGEAVWTKGHIGVYIGDGLAVESTPSWANKVQITACNNPKAGYKTRKWTKHGKLPYIDYGVTAAPSAPAKTEEPKKTTTTATTTTATTTKVEAARNKDKSLTGVYRVNTSAGLHIRTGAGVDKKSLGVLKVGTIVRNYGYYNVASNGVKWLYVKTDSGLLGYCSSAYLKKS